MFIYYLYLKTHNITGLKYLGQTTQDPYIYSGSGKIWKEHLKEHGYDIKTEILYCGPDKEEMKRVGRYYSTLWNIVESIEWANLIPETGGGCGGTRHWSEDTRRKMSQKQTGKKLTSEHREKISNSMTGIKRTEDHNNKLAMAKLGTSRPKLKCPHCHKEGGTGNMQRWHFANCKFIRS